MSRKIAVILFNLGGPRNRAEVKTFLYRLFSDPLIIRIPSPLRQILARLIAGKRAKEAAGIYEQIGGGSPILENTEAQARALEAALYGTAKCFTVMRYTPPFAKDVARAVKDFAPDEIVLLPLYPQFSTTTSLSSLRNWHKAAHTAGLDVPTKTVCCYPDEPGFIQTMAHTILAALDEAEKHGQARLLFSAHGLPEKIVKAGDPYQYQCERTVAALVRETGATDHVLCYQSRVGPLRWLGPSTEEEILRAGHDRVPAIVVPMTFVSEHSETLYEIDIFYRDLARRAGVPYFARTQTAGTSAEFINGLAGLVREASKRDKPCASQTGVRLCPPQFSGCACRE